MLFFLLIFVLPFALPAIPIAIYTDWSVWCGLVGLGFFVGACVLVRYEGRYSTGNSGLLGLAAVTCLPTGSFALSNFLAALVKYLILNWS